MKPLRLTMQAFGSYGKKTEIDFTRPNQNFFLITGDTGAGKTTIFDAIVFALYGETSSVSNKKDGALLQSHFIGFEEEPFVELEFSEKSGEEEILYKVRRKPRHIRPLRRGKGETEEKEEVSLILEDGSEYSHNVKETNAKLEEIIGLTKGQFMQVSMIAQGEFMDLLRAKSDEKKIIFRKLFHTELYQDIVDELGRRRKEKLTEMAKIRTACQTEAGHIEVPGGWEKAQDLNERIARLMGEDKFSVTNLEGMLEELEHLCLYLDDEKGRIQEEYRQAGIWRDKSRDACQEAQNLLKSFRQLEKATKELEEYKAKREEIKQLAVLAVSVEDAYEVKTLAQSYQDALHLVEDTEKKLEEQQLRLPALKQDHEEAAQAEIRMKERQEQQLEAFTRVSEKVKKAREQFRSLEAAKADAMASEEEDRKAQRSAALARESLEQLESQELSWRKQAQELSDAERQLVLWEGRQAEAEAITLDVAAWKKAVREGKRQEEKAEKAKAEYALASREFSEKNAVYLEKQTVFLDAQAGFLAKEKLRPGLPCPVCGSLEHPSPSRLSEDDRHLTREIIEALAEETAKLQKKQQKLSEASGAAMSALAEKQSAAREMQERLILRMRKSIPAVEKNTPQPDEKNIESVLEKWKAQLKEEGEILRKNAGTLTAVRTALQNIDSEKQKRRAQVEEARKLAEETGVKRAKTHTLLESLSQSVEYPSEKEADREEADAAARKKEADTAWQQARKKAQKLRSEMENAHTLLERYEAELPGLKERMDQRKAKYQEGMEDKHLSENRWKELTQNYQKEQAADFRERIEQYHKNEALAEKAKSLALEAIEGRALPRVEELEAERKAAEEKWNAIGEQQKRISETERVNRAAYNALAPKMQERSARMEEYQRIDTLCNLLGGKVSGARMDIETYVQRYYLERILEAANLRFQEMSAGQFELRMYDIDKAGEGKNHGLDLMVYSAVTGKVREVRTLSGGESFMAALSLALGMADQIQAASSSIHTDIMFIDEGFGSLDDHARDQAVRVLAQMAGGSRMIGIISHVTELKHEIEDQLLVSKDETGSHVRWQIS